MGNKIIIVFMTCLSFGMAGAQTLTKKATLKKLHPAFSSGASIIASRNQKTSITFKFDESVAYVVEFGGITITMNKVSVGDEKAPKKTKIETPKYEDKKVITRDVIAFGRDVYLIAKHEDKKTDKYTLLSYKVDLNNFTLSSSPTILDTYTDSKEEEASFGFEEVGKTGLLVTREIWNKQTKTKSTFFLMFDKNMKKLWEHEVNPPVKGNKGYFSTQEFFKDEDHLLLTCRISIDGSDKMIKDGKPNFTYHLFYYTNKMQTMKDFELELENKLITDMSFGITDAGKIIVAGFYSDNISKGINANAKSFGKLSGCFYMCIDAETKKVEKTSLKEFDDDFILSIMNKRQKRQAKRKAGKGEDIDAPAFDLRDLYYDDRGGVLLIAEDYYVIQHTRTSTGSNGTTSTSTYYTYHYDDIIAVSINKEGDIAWNTKIDKKLTFAAPVSESFVTISEKGKWVFLYNENLNNLKDSEDEDGDDNADLSAGRRHSAPVIVVLDDKGKYTKEVLMMPEGKKSITVDHDFHLVMENKGHIIKITDPDGTNFYRLDLKL